jgi:hypothetical protein
MRSQQSSTSTTVYSTSTNSSGEKIMNKRLIANVIGCACLTLASAAEARTSYDGPWNLVFVTQRGSCDPTYNFSVNINDGVVTHPNLVKFSGYVGRSGAVRASVTVHDKYASGSGRLTRDAGGGTWSGRAGGGRCSGYWTAQRSN